jgi:hypothetical protein
VRFFAKLGFFVATALMLLAVTPFRVRRPNLTKCRRRWWPMEFP